MICKNENGFELLIQLFQDLSSPEKSWKVLQIVEKLSDQCKDVNLYAIYKCLIGTIVKLMSDEN